MKTLMIIAAATLLPLGAASAQPTVRERTTTTVTTPAGDTVRQRTVVRTHGGAVHVADRGHHYGWRNHHRRVCRTVWRHHHRVRRCWWR